MQSVAIQGTLRETIDKKATKAIRKEDGIPCVMYGGSEVHHFSAPAPDFRHLVYTPDFKIAEIELNGQTYKAIIKDVQFHPVTDKILHIDFVELVTGQAVKLELPIKLVGQAEGAKIGGQVVQKMRRILVKTMPENLIDRIEAIEVDITALNMGQSARVRDIPSQDGMEVFANPSLPVATIEVPRAMRSAEAAAEGEEGVEETEAVAAEEE